MHSTDDILLSQTLYFMESLHDNKDYELAPALNIEKQIKECQDLFLRDSINQTHRGS